MQKTVKVYCKDVKKWLIKHQPNEPKGNSLRRITVLACLISALTKSERASLKSIGEQMEDKTDLESRIKKAKRWLNNKWTDTTSHFIPYIKPIIRTFLRTKKIVLAIDGSTMGNGCMCLMVSIIWRNRAIPICWIVRKAPKGHFPEQMHLDVIEMVKKLFDSVAISADISTKNVEITLLGDGEFDGTQLQESCSNAGWNYVLKTAKNTLIADNPEMDGASQMKNMLPDFNMNHIYLPDMYINKQGFGTVNVVYWHDSKYKNPLYLLTNIDNAPQVEKLYRKRYIIETLFADLKSRGFNMEWTRISNPLTIFNLLIVACLAYILAILHEFDARKSAIIGRFCRKDRINDLSVFQLGLRAILHAIKHQLSISFQFSKNFP